MNSDRISRHNPLEWGDMMTFLLKMIEYRATTKEANAFSIEESAKARELMSRLHEIRAGQWWNEVTDVLLWEEYTGAAKALGERYSKEQIIDMFQQVTQVLLSYFNLRECYDATRLMDEYENGGFGNEKNI